MSDTPKLRPTQSMGERSKYRCPQCGAPEVVRERRPFGDSRCSNGHNYKSERAIDSTEQKA